jgi:hypothetical protein
MDGDSGNDRLFADRAGEHLSNGEHVRITVRSGMPQVDDWSCGPNSATRLLNAYGSQVAYETLMQDAQDSNVITDWELGTPPPYLQEIMQQYKSDVQWESDASLNTVLNLIGQGKPVIALTGRGEFPYPQVGGFDLGPEKLHYVLLTGFDLNTQQLFFMDTDGASKTWSYGEFGQLWDWDAGPLADAFLSTLGVDQRTILY